MVDRYDWSGGGEEWTGSAEWKQALIDDVLLPLVPAGAAVLEIGPGAGRWSQVLAAQASRLVLVDVSEEPLRRCRERLTGFDNVSYVHGRGASCPGSRTPRSMRCGPLTSSCTSRRRTSWRIWTRSRVFCASMALL